jgi:hypothetical protein
MAPKPTLHLAAPAPDLVGVVEAGIVVRQPANTSASRFPALPRAMLTLVRGADAVEFHTLSLHPVTHVHGQPFEALGLVLPPETAARLMGPSTGALVDARLPWSELAGASEATRLADTLYRADSHDARLRAMQESLRRVLSRGPERVRRARTESLTRLCGTVGVQGPRAAFALGIGEAPLPTETEEAAEEPKGKRTRAATEDAAEPAPSAAKRSARKGRGEKSSMGLQGFFAAEAKERE